ncbi:MAG: MarR family transcriptional regulator [Pseudomonadota bacterium]
MKDGTDSKTMEVFGFFNEVGIINQLSSAILAKCLPDGVHPSHFSIVNHLVRMGDGKAPVRIAAAMQVTKNTMTHSLKVLEDKGFITVEPDPADGRGKLVRLTDAGRTFRETAIQSVMARFEDMIEPAHRDAMKRVMSDLILLRKHLDENR